MLDRRVLEIIKAINSLDLLDGGPEINLPIENTCDWVFDTPQFVDWWSDDPVAKMLCVHGRIGAGKSTLAKHMTAWITNSAYPTASYFVKSSKDTLSGCSPAYVYRALLCQFLCIPDVRGDILEVFDTRIHAMLVDADIDDLRHELYIGLQQALRKPRDTWVNIIIDGIDNCTDPGEIFRFFRDAVVASSARTRICYTCRQNIAIPDPAYAYIAIEDFNYEDIGKYIQIRLPATSIINKSERDFLQSSIEDNSSGVFLWVVMAVNLIQEHLTKGRDVPFLQRVLEDLPKELSKLYHNILTRAVRTSSAAETRAMTHVLQWILFSARPLTTAEWHHVMAFIESPDLRSIRQWKNSPSYTESNELLLQRIRSLCCGLVEVKARHTPFEQSCMQSEVGSLGAGAGSFESQQYLDVIHESVYEYLVNGNGFKLLDPQIQNSIGAGHTHLLEVCARYCNLEEMLDTFTIPHSSILLPRDQRSESRGSEESDGPILVEAATRSPTFYRHENCSDDAISLGGSASGSIRSGRSDRSCRKYHIKPRLPWKSVVQASSDMTFRQKASNDKHRAVRSLSRVLSFINDVGSPGDHPRGIEVNRVSAAPPIMSRHTTVEVETVIDPPILWQYCQDMLVHHAVAVEQAGLNPGPVIDFLLGTWDAVRRDMHQGATLLYFAAQWNLVSWIDHLQGAGTEAKGGELHYPVIVAACNDNLSAFQHLIGRGRIYFKLRWPYIDPCGRTALHHAAMIPDSLVLAYIHERRQRPRRNFVPEMSARDRDNLTPLHLAAMHGTYQNVFALIELGASVSALDIGGNNPLHLACVRRHFDCEIAQSLISAGCSRKRANLDGKTAVTLAREYHNAEVAAFIESVPSPADERAMTLARQTRRRELQRRHNVCLSLVDRLRQHMRLRRRNTEGIRQDEYASPMLSGYSRQGQERVQSLPSETSKKTCLFCC